MGFCWGRERRLHVQLRDSQIQNCSTKSLAQRFGRTFGFEQGLAKHLEEDWEEVEARQLSLTVARPPTNCLAPYTDCRPAVAHHVVYCLASAAVPYLHDQLHAVD